MREDLRKQFSSEDGDNPLADVPGRDRCAAEQCAEQQDEQLRAMSDELEATRLEVEQLQAEKEKLEELAAEHDRGTAKGRPYEEAVSDALDAIARAQGDDCDAVGDIRGEGGRKGDVVVGDRRAARARRAAGSSSRPRTRSCRSNEALRRARRGDGHARRRLRRLGRRRPRTSCRPARTPLREFNGDKLFVVYDPEDGSRSRSRSPTRWPAPAC